MVTTREKLIPTPSCRENNRVTSELFLNNSESLTVTIPNTGSFSRTLHSSISTSYTHDKVTYLASRTCTRTTVSRQSLMNRSVPASKYGILEYCFTRVLKIISSFTMISQ